MIINIISQKQKLSYTETLVKQLTFPAISVTRVPTHSFHWLCASERIQFKLAVLVYRALHGTAPCYLTDLLRRVADMRSWSRLQSSSISRLDVRSSCRVTVGDRSFAVAGPRIWNSLPDDITSAPSLSVFHRKLKTHLFRQPYPDCAIVVPRSFFYLGHFKNCNEM